MNSKSKLSTALTAASLSMALLTIPPASASELRCASSVDGNNYCRTDTSRGVELLYQHSRYDCYRNDTWGYDDHGIWVSDGCTATFRVGDPEREYDDDTAANAGLGALALAIIGAAASNQNNNNSSQHSGGYEDNYDDDERLIISCDSKRNKYRHCPTPVRNRVELVRQKSSSACRFNKSWGYDRRGVWVSKGCRAEFAIY